VGGLADGPAADSAGTSQLDFRPSNIRLSGIDCSMIDDEAKALPTRGDVPTGSTAVTRLRDAGNDRTAADRLAAPLLVPSQLALA
jgi:hypothetical protein